ncbi:hypothetical protein [Planomicrobium sp. CPCC 101079]|uniref:hypothetical protein n=1 Tax=Planomicrobium sp. CPCC 101079 TaxID=2599618 RepID=UPI0011B7534C|nr:hypothetical protein [Planomicrobium sp. CPCC 101079]TWT04731.1 hypothetical protein FQV28_09005 [Planomicrobium sp. CPCC 101079]
MKSVIKTLSASAVLFSLLAATVLAGGAENVSANEPATDTSFSAYETQAVEQGAKYSKKVMEAIRVELGVDAKSVQADGVIEQMPKVQVMDLYLSSFGKKVKGNEVRLAVEEVFTIDLAYISKKNYGSQLAIYPANVMESLRSSFNVQPDSTEQDGRVMDLAKNEVMDRYIKVHNYRLTGAEIRILINQIFGVNLDGISTLEHAQLAISSKGQWIVKSDTDLFVLESSLDDVDVSVYATDYFKEATGSKQLPESLKTKLMDLGFTYSEEANLLYYKNPTNESVPDAFKGQVLGIIVGTISTEYQN